MSVSKLPRDKSVTFKLPSVRIQTVACFVATMVIAASALASDRLYLKKNEIFCDTSKTLCLYGSFTYRVNSRIVSLNARVQKQTGPGEIYILLSGRNRQNDLRRAEIRIQIRGTYSEIIDYKMRPDAPDVSEWELSLFTFEAESN